MSSSINLNVEIYVQGSFATNTTVKPLTENQSEYGPGEFDVDIVLERTEWGGAKDALEEVESILGEFAKYDSRVSADKESCVRIKYSTDNDTGVGFHVDIVPIKNIDGKRQVARRTADEWEDSDSKQLIRWTKEQQGAYPYLTATVLFIKRMRDMAGLTNQLTSIIIFSLLKDAYQDRGNYADDLLVTLEQIETKLSCGLNELEVTNPINPHREDLIKKWRDDPSIFESICDFITSTRSDLQTALATTDTEALRLVLSDDFPLNIPPRNIDSMRSESITIAGTPELKQGAIIASSNSGRHTSTNLWTFFERNQPIRFRANNTNKDENILWQVCNAPGSESLRGNFFEARAKGGGEGSSSNPSVNHENEQYKGRHWIRFIGFNDKRQLTTMGARFSVDVKINSQSLYQK